MKVHDRIATYPDFSELVSEAVSEPYPILGEQRIKQHRANLSALKEAVIDCDDAESGRILRIMIHAQLHDWRGDEQEVAA